MISMLTELLTSQGGGMSKPNGECANDTEIISALPSQPYNTVISIRLIQRDP